MRIKGWDKFQHFKDRRPPWIKLYRGLLDDKEWHKLDDSAAKLLVMLWLLGSEEDGNLPDADEIAFRVRLPLASVEQSLKCLSHWVDQLDINVISERYQFVPVAVSPNSVAEVSVYQETETELEKERETEKDKKPRKRVSSSEEVSKPEDVTEQTWADYLKVRKAKKAGSANQTAIDGIRKEAFIANISMEDALATCCVRNWVGFEASWLLRNGSNGMNRQEAL